jgi:hypothetical protein
LPTVQTLKSTSASSVPASERRRSPRKPHVVEASLGSPTGGKPLKVTSVDLSKHGVGLSVAKPIAAGTFHVLNLGLGTQRIAGEVRVLSCRKEADGSYRVHAEFR